VTKVERRLSMIEELEAVVEVTLIGTDRLRQLILSQAFTGRLGKDAFYQCVVGTDGDGRRDNHNSRSPD
jgi:hypothetical protein